MNSTDGALSFDAVINNTNFKRQIDEMEAKIKGLTSTAQKQGSDMEATFSKLAAVAGTAFAGVGLAGFVTQLVSVRAEFQSLDASFTTMLGSKAKANELMNQIKQSALTTPFEVKELATGAKSLLAYGIAAEDVNATMLKLGDVASGLNIPFTELTQIYGKINTQGRLFAEDINQLQGRGIPIVQELAKTYGKSTEQIKLMVEAGKIGFKDVETVINNLTSAGGMFYKSMEAQSKTLNGQISNMQDAWSNMLNALGTESEGVLSGAITGATSLINNYEEIIDIIKVMVTMYGAYKTAVMVSSVAQVAAASAATGWTIASKLQYNALLLMEKAQTALNKTMLGNPYVLAAVAVAGMAAAIYQYTKSVDYAGQAQDRFNDSLEKFNEEVQNNKGTADAMFAQLNAAAKGTETYAKAKQAIIDQYGAFLQGNQREKEALIDSGKAYAIVTAEIEKQARAKYALTASQDAYTAYGKIEQKGIDKLYEVVQKRFGDKVGSDGIKLAETYWAKMKPVLLGLKDMDAEVKKIIEDNFNQQVTVGGGAGMASTTYTENPIMRQIEQLNRARAARDQELKQIQDKYKTDATDEDKKAFDASSASLGQLDAELVSTIDLIKALNAEKENGGVIDEKKLADSISQTKAIEDNIKKREKELYIIDDVSSRIKMLEAQKGNYGKDDKKLVELDKRIAILREKLPEKDSDAKKKAKEEENSYEKSLEEKKKLYAAYQKWIDAYNKDSADKQFAELIKNGQGYIDYLEREKARIKSDIEAGKGGKDGAKNLDIVENQLLDVKTGKSQIERFGDELKDAKANAASLADYIDLLDQKATDLGNNKTDFGIAASGLVQVEINNARKEQKDVIAKFLKDVTDYNEKKKQINDKYDALQKEVNDKGANLTVEQAQIATDKIEAMRKQDLDDVKIKNLEQTDSFKKMISQMESSTLKALKKKKAEIDEYIKVAESEGIDQNGDYYKGLKKDSDAITTEIADKTHQQYTQLAYELGGILSQSTDEMVQKMGQLLGQISGTMGTLGDKNASGFSKATSIVSLAITAGNMLKDIRVQGDLQAIEAVKARTAEVANQIGYETEINKLYSERQATQEKSLFLGTDYTKTMTNSMSDVAKFNGQLDSTMGALVNNTVFTAEGKAKRRLFGTKTGTYEFSLADVFGNNAPNKFVGNGASDLTPLLFGSVGAQAGNIAQNGGSFKDIAGSLLDPAGLFGGYADGKAKQNAFGNLQGSVNSALSAMGKSVGDFAKMSNEDLLTFYDLMEKSGNITDEGTKKLIASAKEQVELAKQAKEKFDGVITELAGGLGNSIKDILVEGFKGGFGYGVEQAKAVSLEISKILENMMSSIIYQAAFSQMFSELETGMKASYDKGGDMTWVDDFKALYAKIPEASLQFNEGMKQAQDLAKQSGFDLWGKGGDSKSKGLEGAIKSITSDQANLIGGQMTAIRMNQAESLMIVRQQLLHMSEIAINTRYLKSIDAKLDNLPKATSVASDPLRAKGITA